MFFGTKKGFYKYQSYDPKHKEILEKTFDSDEDEDLTSTTSKTESSAKTEFSAKTESSAKIKERIYDTNEDFIYVNHTTKSKT